MTYQVLARKWRPQDFASIVGQEPIVTALRNALVEDRIAQAYLFSGIRGVGKTTAARVLAKALNCERRRESVPPSPDPCNDCPSCRQITAGSDLDVLEIDAATYSKVEQIRELTESLRYGPANDRYKVVVLDEVHRLSRQAFDALLKIVEEPPAHLVFIFATTEIDAVPATILSRCQEFQFRRVPSGVLAQHLREISDAEGIAASDAALRLVARAGEGSVRDSVAILDQLATFGGGAISDQDAKGLLGGLDAAIFLRLLGAILGGEPATVSAVAREVGMNGWDPANVFGQFLVFCRDGLHLAMGGQAETLDLPLEEAEALAQLVRPFGYENLLRLTQLLLRSEPSVRRSELGALALEIAWLRAAELPKLTRVEELLAGRAPAPLPERPPAGRAAAERAAPPPVRRAEDRPPAELRRPAGRSAPPPTDDVPADEAPTSGAAPAPAAAGGAALAGGGELVPDFLERLRARRPSLAALLKPHREQLAVAGGNLLVPAGDAQLAAALTRPVNQQLFAEALAETWGSAAAWTWHRADSGAAAAPPTAASAAAPRPAESDDTLLAEVRRDPTVRAVLEIFDGSKIHSVETRSQD